MLLIKLALLFTAALVQSQSYDDQSVPLYITEPACDSYQCEIQKNTGEKLKINWLNPPSGNVMITLEGTNNGPTFTIAKSVPGSSSGCYKGENGQRPCGQFTYTLSNKIRPGKYSVAVHSIDHPDKVGYTDIIKISNDRKMKRSVLPSQHQ
ncbi:secreted protein [Melampsora americana]|nr:secreted protein [Melampsora americana]